MVAVAQWLSRMMPNVSPPGSNALTSAVAWLQGTLLGPAATAIAVIAIASVGFMMLSGRTDVRRAAQVVLGCFIIFGASAIAAGIQSAVTGISAGAERAETPATPPAAPLPQAYPKAEASPYDPYAGASVPPVL